MAEDRSAYLAAINAPTSIAYRRVDIFEADGETPYLLDAPLMGGQVSVDQTRAERRIFDVVLNGKLAGDKLRHHPGGLWYDKVVKMHRGVKVGDTIYQDQVIEAVVDTIKSQNFASGVAINGRDYTKRLLAKFSRDTAYRAGEKLEDVIKVIASNAGIANNKMILPATGVTLPKDETFERNSERKVAIDQLANAYGYDVFFNPQGYMVMEKWHDPVTSPTVHTFRTGYQGNLASYEKSTNDTRIYNHIIVVGTGNADGELPIIGEAINLQPDSPTNVAKLGDRLFEMSSSMITTQAQADDLAAARLRIMALEQFDLNLSTLVVPWLDVGQIVRFEDPDPNPGDPTRFLLSNFSIPMGLGAMDATARRVTIVS